MFYTFDIKSLRFIVFGIFNFFLNLYLFISTLLGDILSIAAISFDESFNLISAEKPFFVYC